MRKNTTGETATLDRPDTPATIAAGSSSEEPGGQTPAREGQPDDAKLNNIILGSLEEAGDGTLNYGVHLNFTIALPESGESEQWQLRKAAITEFEESDVAAERRRIAETVASWKSERTRGAVKLEELEAAVAKTVAELGDPSQIEKLIPQVVADNAALSRRIELIRPQVEDLDRKALAAVQPIAERLRVKRIAQCDAEREAAFRELCATPALQRLLIAQLNYGNALRASTVATDILPITRPSMPSPARPSSPTMLGNVRGQPTAEPSGPPPGAEYYGGRPPREIVHDGVGTPHG